MILQNNEVNSEHLRLPAEAIAVFETLPYGCLILAPDLRMLTASNIYLNIVGKSRTEITDKYIFDVFGKSDAETDVTDNDILWSLKQVLLTRQPHELPVTRFDTPDPANPSTLLVRYWKTSHTPVLLNNGEIYYIIHNTSDVTEQVLKEKELQDSLQTEKDATAKAELLSRQMEMLFHEIPAQIAIVRGPDLVYDYINPQYKKELFPNRDVLGLPLLAALPEIEGKPIWDMLQKVYQTGQTYIQNEIHVQLASSTGGRLNDHYFNAVYQPLRNIAGQIYAILSFKYEITEHVAARKLLEMNEQELMALNSKLSQAYLDLQAINEELHASGEELQTANEELSSTNEELQQTHEYLMSVNETLEKRVQLRTQKIRQLQEIAEHQRDRLRRFFMQAPAGICVLDGPTLVFELVNPPYQQLFPNRDLLGKPLLEALPEVIDAPVWETLQTVYKTGKTFEGHELLIPLSRSKDSPVEERYFDFIYQARLDAAGEVDGIMCFVFEVTETVLHRRKEEENEKRFRFLLNAIPQQVWTAQPNGALSYVNDVVCTDFGKSTDEIVGHGWQMFIHPDDLAGCLQKWQAALQSGSEYLVEFRLRFLDGQYYWHLGRAVPLIEDGKISLWLGTNTNIEVQKQKEHKKDEFLSIASHELKTPLTSIKAFNQLMRRTNDKDKIHTFIYKSTDHITRLEKLINDLLDVTRINAGKMVYDMQPFDFASMIQESVESVQLTTLTHQIILKNAAQVTINGDKLRLEQVINNFLINAVKYSPNAQKVIVNSKIEQDNLIVSVQDFGIGIANEHLHKLFERYYRIDNTAMRFEGLGLGLFIASEILKRHHGSFWIESEPDEGSTFYFRLPLNPAVKEQFPQENAHFYQDEHITINHNTALQCIENDWKGFHNLDTIQNCCFKLLHIIQQTPVSKILNDNTNVLGTWSDAAEWVGQEYFPMLEKAGVRYMAWIYSPSAFSQLSAQKSVDVAIGNIVTQFFTDKASAEEWLRTR